MEFCDFVLRLNLTTNDPMQPAVVLPHLDKALTQALVVMKGSGLAEGFLRHLPVQDLLGCVGPLREGAAECGGFVGRRCSEDRSSGQLSLGQKMFGFAKEWIRPWCREASGPRGSLPRYPKNRIFEDHRLRL